MPVQFHSSDFIDIVLFSGKDVNYQSQLEQTRLIGEAQKKVLGELQASYDAYKTQLSFNYEMFLEKVERNISHLQEPGVPSDVREAVSAKLETLAKERISTEEKKFSWLHALFHKIGQVFQGHGFRTEGEWGVQLATRLRQAEGKFLERELRSYIRETAPSQVDLDFMKRINGLSDQRFKEILRNVFFLYPEDIRFGEKNKMTIYKGLNDQKILLFYEQLLSQPYWYNLAYNILEGGTSEEIRQLIRPEMVLQFQKAPDQIVMQFRSIPLSDSNKIFFKSLLESAIKDLLRKSSHGEKESEFFLEITQILRAVKEQSATDMVSQILQEPEILSPQDIEALRTNIHSSLLQ